MAIKQKEFDQVERVACAALNLLGVAGLIDINFAQLLVMTGRHDMLTEKLNAKRAELVARAN